MVKKCEFFNRAAATVSLGLDTNWNLLKKVEILKTWLHNFVFNHFIGKAFLNASKQTISGYVKCLFYIQIQYKVTKGLQEYWPLPSPIPLVLFFETLFMVKQFLLWLQLVEYHVFKIIFFSLYFKSIGSQIELRNRIELVINNFHHFACLRSPQKIEKDSEKNW